MGLDEQTIILLEFIRLTDKYKRRPTLIEWFRETRYKLPQYYQANAIFEAQKKTN